MDVLLVHCTCCTQQRENHHHHHHCRFLARGGGTVAIAVQCGDTDWATIGVHVRNLGPVRTADLESNGIGRGNLAHFATRPQAIDCSDTDRATFATRAQDRDTNRAAFIAKRHYFGIGWAAHIESGPIGHRCLAWLATVPGGIHRRDTSRATVSFAIQWRSATIIKTIHCFGTWITAELI
jgi:hypothetical protein